MRTSKLFMIILLVILCRCSGRDLIDEKTFLQECSNVSFSDWKGWSVSLRPDAGYYIIQFHNSDTVQEHLILLPKKHNKVRLMDRHSSADHFTPLEGLKSDSLWLNNYSLMKEKTLREIASFVQSTHIESLRVYENQAYFKGESYDLCYSFQGDITPDSYERIDGHWSRRRPNH